MKENRPILVAIMLFIIVALASVRITAQTYDIVAYSDNTIKNCIQDSGEVVFSNDSIIIDNNTYQAIIVANYSTTYAYKQKKHIVILSEGRLYANNDSIDIIISKVEFYEYIALTIHFNKWVRFEYYLKKKYNEPVIW